jgi:hypothetical protein
MGTKPSPGNLAQICIARLHPESAQTCATSDSHMYHAVQPGRSNLTITHEGDAPGPSFPVLIYAFDSTAFADLVPVQLSSTLPSGVNAQASRSGNEIGVLITPYPAGTRCTDTSAGYIQCLLEYRLVSIR